MKIIMQGRRPMVLECSTIRSQNGYGVVRGLWFEVTMTPKRKESKTRKKPPTREIDDTIEIVIRNKESEIDFFLRFDIERNDLEYMLDNFDSLLAHNDDTNIVETPILAGFEKEKNK